MAAVAADVCVVGGGIVGLAIARELLLTRPGSGVVVLEKEPEIGRHQTTHNSGVVHAGLYYAPGSLKAQLCRRGVGLLRAYCTERGIPFQEIGKLVVARTADEEQRLRAIQDRATRNEVPDLKWLDSAGMRDVEPQVVGVAALHSPRTSVTDFRAVAGAYAADVVALGGSVLTRTQVTRIRQTPTGVDVLAGGERFRFGSLVGCAGLQSDLLAKAAGRPRDPAIIPFRGEYYELVPPRGELVRGMIYPVPDPTLPFLGIHLTRHVDGVVSVGPNAVLALSREGYAWRDVSPRDVVGTLAWPGFWRLARRYWRTGLGEMRMSLAHRSFLDEARTFVPSLRQGDLVPGMSGVRAQALGRRGELVEDFVIDRTGRVTLVRNAPSPAATSSLAIAEHVVRLHHAASG